MLNVSKGNMYPFVDATFNICKGLCPHKCVYCYMSDFKLKPIRLDESEFKTKLGKDNFIFVGSSTDMWADNIPDEWIAKILGYCSAFDNKYLFQTKNPKRFNAFIKYLPQKSVLACTVETDNNELIKEYSKAPLVSERMDIMTDIKLPKMISVEPVMNFDLAEMVSRIKTIQPDFVSIGADSKGHNLPEPNADKVRNLIASLKTFTEVVIKKNLTRIFDTPKPKGKGFSQRKG